MKDASQYVFSLLDRFPRYELLSADENYLKFGKLAEWMTQKLLRKKFRKRRVHQETRDDVLKKVKLSIKANKPLYFIVLFGGYKHFWNSSYPEVDFAELFNLDFMSHYFAPVLGVYKPGVILDYGSEDVIMTLMDNYPQKDLDHYAQSFEKLIGLYSRVLPKNYRINYVRTGQTYDSEGLKAKVKKLLPGKKKEWKKLLPEEKKKLLHRSHRSIMWRGEEDWASLSKEEKEEKIKESKIIEDTFYEVEEEYLGDYFTADNHIPIVLSWGLSDENIYHWLTLGSTFSSVVDFWIGRGILEQREKRFIPRILSREQYEAVKKKLERVKIDGIPLKNFQSIEVYPGILRFDKVFKT